MSEKIKVILENQVNIMHDINNMKKVIGLLAAHAVKINQKEFNTLMEELDL